MGEMSDPASLYEQDFYAWTQDQAAALRALPEGLRPNALDVKNIAEEIESLGRSDRRAVGSLLQQVIVHLLKLALTPQEEPRRGWRNELLEFRSQIERLLEESPSLAAKVTELAAAEWPRARRLLLRDLSECGPRPGNLPDTLPFTDDQLLDPDWFPPPPTA
jgi:hypothetical protein